MSKQRKSRFQSAGYTVTAAGYYGDKGGIVSGDDSEEARVHSTEVGEHVISENIAGVRSFLLGWKDRLDMIPGDGTAEHLSRKVQELPRHLGIMDILKSTWSARFIPDALNALEKWKDAVNVLQNSWEMVGDKKPVSIERFLDILTQSLDNVTLNHPITLTRCVRVGNVMRERSFPSDHLFIGGLIDGDFPRHFLSFDLLDDWERRAINHFFGEVRLPERTHWRSEEPMIFYSAIAGARKSLTVSFPILGADHREKASSPYLECIEHPVKKLSP